VTIAGGGVGQAGGMAMSAMLDWIATGASVGGVLVALCAGEVAQRVAILAGPAAHQRAVAAMCRWVNRGARLAGTRFVASGLEHARGGPFVIVMNHQSLLDISMVGEHLAHLAPRYVSKIELARRIPGVSFNLRRGGSVCIDRSDSAQARAALAEMGRRVHDQGLSVVIFPEGTRSRDGAMKRFKPGGLRTLLAAAPGVRVLPISSSGGSRMFRRGLAPLERGVELRMVIHPPVAPPDPADDAAFAAFVAGLEATIASGIV
jgi:1-acyl-sn-glycerol-3-phosphate acyltransferase